MKEVHINSIIDLTEKLCIEANCYLNNDIKCAFQCARKTEKSELGKSILNTLLENAEIACNECVPICQDTGLVVIFAEIGRDVHITGGNLEAAINEGVRRGYDKGYLRKSVVKDPINRENTKDNTPAVIHYDIADGESIKITVAPKGFGSENMSRLVMLKPSDGLDGVKKFVVETVSLAGGNACPPVIVGIGVGGTMEKCALISKRALLRPVGTENKDEFWNGVEKEMLATINNLGIGPSGFGGNTTALAVHIETYPTHIAGLPVSVNLGCHVTRHAEGIL